MRLTKLFPSAQSLRHPDPPRHAAEPAPSTTHAAQHRASAEATMTWSFATHRMPKGEVGVGGRRLGEGVLFRGRGDLGGGAGTTEERQEHQAAHLPKRQRQPLSNLRTNLSVFFINTRVISLQDKPLLGFFTFFIF